MLVFKSALIIIASGFIGWGIAAVQGANQSDGTKYGVFVGAASAVLFLGYAFVTRNKQA